MLNGTRKLRRVYHNMFRELVCPDKYQSPQKRETSFVDVSPTIQRPSTEFFVGEAATA